MKPPAGSLLQSTDDLVRLERESADLDSEAEASGVRERQFFATAEAAFARAVESAGEHIRCFQIAGTRLRVRFAGAALLATVEPGLANPVEDVETDGPVCEVCVWDTESTGVELPPPPCPVEDLTGRGPIWGLHSSRYRSAFQWGESSVSLMDRHARRAYYWAPSATRLPVWVLGAPLRTILHWWIQDNGMHLVHAAAVGFDGRGVLIPGRGGSGKSSTALACLHDGFDYISDDYLALALDPEPRVYRLFNTAKLDPGQMARFPDLSRRCRTVHEEGFDKTILYLDSGYREQMRDSLPLTLILTPRISGEEQTRFGPVPPQEIEAAMASETIGHLPHAGADTIALLERASLEAPIERIHLGTDRTAIVDCIRQRLARPAAAAKRTSDAHLKPFVSILVHLQDDDVDVLDALVRDVSDQHYHRAELLVTTDRSKGELEARAAQLVRELGISVIVLPFEETSLPAAALNRGIRESFGELLLLLESGDRLPDNALVQWVDRVMTNPSCGVFFDAAEPDQRLTRCLVRKQLFRTHGLPEVQTLGAPGGDWLARMGPLNLIDRGNSSLIQRGASRRPELHRLRWLKEQLDRQRASSAAQRRS